MICVTSSMMCEAVSTGMLVPAIGQFQCALHNLMANVRSSIIDVQVFHSKEERGACARHR